MFIFEENPEDRRTFVLWCEIVPLGCREQAWLPILTKNYEYVVVLDDTSRHNIGQ